MGLGVFFVQWHASTLWLLSAGYIKQFWTHFEKGKNMARRFKSVLLAAILMSSAFGSYAVSSNRQKMMDYVVPPATMVGGVPSRAIIHLAIGLPPRDAEGLRALADEVSTPGNKKYHQFLSLEQVTDRFGPSAADYQSLIDWARRNRLKVEAQYPHRLLLGVSGRAVDVGRALAVKLHYAERPDGSRFYKPDRVPSLNLDTKISHIAGVDNFFVPHSRGGSQLGGTAYASFDLRNAYADKCLGLTGAGESIGIMAYGGYSHADVAAYQSAAGLASSGTCGASTATSPPCLTDVMVGGFAGGINGFSTEAAADVELSIAMAPGLHQVKVFEGDSSGGCASGDNIVAAMAAATDVKQFSSSVGFCVSDNIALLEAMAIAGQSFFISSGDAGSGFTGNFPNFNYFLQAKLTVIGGTVLAMNGSGISYQSEQAWKFSGGGVENFPTFPATCPTNCIPGTAGCSNNCIPAWQQGIVTPQNGASATYRNEPDLAMPAQNVYIEDHSNGVHTNSFCGTSASAPLMAGFMALANQQKCANSPGSCMKGQGFINPTLYNIGRNASAYSNSIRDISGNSTDVSCGLTGQSAPAVAGYDLATGWGTPKCGLIDQLTCTVCNGNIATQGTPPSATCVSFQSDSNNCGTCGNVCATGAACVNARCQAGHIVGDTHILTFDGLFYDFQASGDFLAATTGASFIVQVRQVPGLPNWPNASIAKAVAMQMGKNRVVVYIDPLKLVVNGKQTVLDDGKSISLADGVEIVRVANVFSIKQSSGETVHVETYSGWMNVTVALRYSPNGALRGLLGNGNGMTQDDIATRDGAVLQQPVSFKDIYHRYADNLRIRPGESLFGDETQAMFGVPAKPFYANELARGEYESARATCKVAGVVGESLLDACALDIVVLDSPAAAKVFANTIRPASVMHIGSAPPHLLNK